MNITDRLTIKQYRNPIIKKFLDRLPEEEIAVAVKTIAFIKNEYPEVREALRGDIIQEESWESHQRDSRKFAS